VDRRGGRFSKEVGDRFSPPKMCERKDGRSIRSGGRIAEGAGHSRFPASGEEDIEAPHGSGGRIGVGEDLEWGKNSSGRRIGVGAGYFLHLTSDYIYRMRQGNESPWPPRRW